MKTHRLAVASLALLSLASLPSPARAADSGGKAGPDAAKVERGKYIVNAYACGDCHTPWKMGENGPEPDNTLMLSGHPSGLALPPPPKLEKDSLWVTVVAGTMTAWSGPWGVSFTRNLTPDAATGIGDWTEKEFIATIRNGKRRGIGRDLLPPMPWPALANLTDDDLASIYAYLRTIPAISNSVPDPLPPAAAPPKE
ncbi:MAG: c-type cytochrome [Acidobacteria bacterium]|nr:c-type cytochrome [Acidobacteriota bacterium]MCB9377319.1 c-type cytochrome [Holophagales bacterium]